MHANDQARHQPPPPTSKASTTTTTEWRRCTHTNCECVVHIYHCLVSVTTGPIKPPTDKPHPENPEKPTLNFMIQIMRHECTLMTNALTNDALVQFFSVNSSSRRFCSPILLLLLLLLSRLSLFLSCRPRVQNMSSFFFIKLLLVQFDFPRFQSLILLPFLSKLLLLTCPALSLVLLAIHSAFSWMPVIHLLVCILHTKAKVLSHASCDIKLCQMR